NLKDVEAKDIIKTIAEWTGKVIIPVDDAMKKKITIYSQKKLPRSHALALIYSALREQGIVAEERDGAILLRPIEDVKIRSVPTVPDNVPLASLINKAEVVQKFFKLQNYSPTQLEKVIQPLMPEHGYVSAIENTSHIVVIDTVGNLERIERIIQQLDVPETKETVTRTFIIQAGDPVEIVQLLNILVGEGELSRPSRPKKQSGRPERRSGRGKSDDKKKAESKAASSVVVGRTDTPITLIPLPKRRWIIAKASAEDMVEIEAWIAELDEKKPDEREHTLVKVKFADVQEVADQINNMIATMPLKANVTVQALRRAKQVMIVGSAENREMIQQLVAEIDVPTDQFITVHIPLEYADPEQIKKNLDELYTQFSYYESRSRYGSYSSRYYRGREASDPDFVRVIAYPTLKQITVIASAENMVKIKEQVKEWDKPIDIGEIGPVIIELKNSDPVKMVDLLTKLFTETERRFSWRDYFYGSGSVSKTMVGPLYGQLAFEPVPDTRKIIVQSKVPEGYAVVRKLIGELDSEEMAEVPRVVTLKYADPEDLSERLNAMFNEPGTNAPIRRIRRGLSEYSMTTTEEGNQRRPGDRGGDTGATGEYRTWWGQGFQRRLGEMPISNVIGRIRFIPDPRSKSILVLSPPEFVKSVKDMIEELDVPGRQVRIKAAILTIDHRDLTSLGLQLATNPAAFGTLDENAITALAALSVLDERGSLTISGTMNVTALLDFLVKKVNAKVLNQQTLWTKDNEEADFFKGDKIAFTTNFSVSEVGGRVTSGFEFEKVGMTLRVRPSITPEKNVDMTINMIISQLQTEIVNEQPVRTEMDTQTTLIVPDGETIMLGGMLFQEDSALVRKIPLFGDIPLLGLLFRHYEVVKANAELLVFVTPYVIDEDPSEMLAETQATIDAEKAKLKKTLAELESKVKDAG
ncbi:MAG: secretin N-terminal domain-containing protein, partial [Planctomycetota bacterium]